MITKYTIYGERCSGTNYLEELINANFDVTLTWQYGFKHFMGFVDLLNSDDTLFICIIRDPHKWINSFYREQWGLPKLYKVLDNFITQPMYYLDSSMNEILSHRNIYNHDEQYNNIFEMRHLKLKYMIDDLPLLVKNYILIKYEDLIYNFDKTMNRIKCMGLKVKIQKFPINIWHYKKKKNVKFQSDSKIDSISNELVKDKFNKHYEKLLGYM